MRMALKHVGFAVLGEKSWASQGLELELDRRVGVKGEGCRYLVRMSQRPEV